MEETRPDGSEFLFSSWSGPLTDTNTSSPPHQEAEEQEVLTQRGASLRSSVTTTKVDGWVTNLTAVQHGHISTTATHDPERINNTFGELPAPPSGLSIQNKNMTKLSAPQRMNPELPTFTAALSYSLLSLFV